MINFREIKQKGSALVIALIFLGVLTMVGVSVTLSSTSQLKIAANGESINDTFHATNAGINLLMSHTAAKGVVAFGSDALLDNTSQSGAEEELGVDFLNTEVYAQTHGEKYGNKGSSAGKALVVSIKQKAKGAVCPRAVKGSSVIKIACDHFELTSKYEVSSSYKPAIKAGVYREMIQANSVTHQALDVSDPT